MLLNQGGGTFSSAVNYAVGSQPHSVAAADFNGDGKPDLVVANSDSSTVSVLLNQGNGTFPSAVNYGGGSSLESVAAADFNGDGKPDLVVANYNSNTVSVLLNQDTAWLALAGSNYVETDGNTAGQLDVWASTTNTGTPSSTYQLSQLSNITDAGGSGDDSLTIDFSNGSPVPAGGLAFDGGGGASSLSIIGTSGNDVITASSSQIVFNGQPISFTNTGQVVLIPGTGTDNLSVTSGSLALDTPSNATAIVAQNFSNITIAASAQLSLPKATHQIVLEVPQTALSIIGTLDLGGNDMIIQGGGATGLTDINSLLKTGFNAGSGYWNGTTGMISSAASSDTTFLTTLGYRAGGSTFDGVNTTSSDTLVKYTYYGDADLNGTVDGADYQQIDNGFGMHLTGWSNGDFNYDGVVDGSDFSLIDNTFNQITAGSLAPLALLAPAAPLAMTIEQSTAAPSFATPPISGKKVFAAFSNPVAAPLFADSKTNAWKLYIEGDEDSKLIRSDMFSGSWFCM